MLPPNRIAEPSSCPPGRVMPRLSGCGSGRPPSSLPSAPLGAQPDPLSTDPHGAGSPPRPLEPASADRHRGRCGRYLSAGIRRAAAGALLSLAALLACSAMLDAGVAQADVLVSNIDRSRTNAANVLSASKRAQGFQTGSGKEYVLESVEVSIRTYPSNAGDPKSAIYEQSGSNPGTKLVDLANPGSISANSIATFTAPADTRLERSTTYYVVFERATGASFEIATTTVDNEDSGGVRNWTIQNDRLSESGTTWNSSTDAFMIRLNGRVYIAPATEGDVGLSKPLNLRARAASMTQIDLSWSRPTTRLFPITGYQIEVSGDGWIWAVLEANTASTSTTYSHTGLRAGRGWFYRVSAVNKRGTGPASNEPFAMTTAPPPSVPETVVPGTWGLIPPGLGPGDKFRLLFVTATSRVGSSSNIEDYNRFVQDAAAAAADTNLASYSSTFRAVASTTGPNGVDARINTAAADPNVPVYWLNGFRVATGHWDFYGNTLYGVTWDNGRHGTRSSGQAFGSGYVLTGTGGTGIMAAGGGLGNRGNVVVGNPAGRPLDAGGTAIITSWPLYGLSGVFQVDPSSPPTVPALWVSDSTGYEFQRAMFFAVTLDPPATETVTVEYYTRAGSATPGTDYVATQGMLTFAPGESVHSIRVEVIDDDVEDAGQTFEMVLINPSSNAEMLDSQALGRIYNSDPNAQEVSIAAATSPVTEGSEAVFTLSRTGGSNEEGLAVTVDPSESGAMLAGTAPTEVTFAAGADAATLTLPTVDDEVAEAASAVTVTVVAEAGYAVAANGTAATVAVADDDAAPLVTTKAALAAPENGTAVASLAASDEDTATADLQWSITGGADAAAFTLSVGGVLAFKAAKDFEGPDDADTDGDYAVTVQVTDGANAVAVALTVGLTDVYEPAPQGTVWSATMTVVEYGTGAVGAATADLFAQQVGSANLRAKWLWYQPSERRLRLAFDDGLDDAEALTVHLGEMTLSFPENSGGNSSFTFEDVDVAWTNGQTLAVRVMEASAETTGAVTDDGAAPEVTTASPILVPENGTAVALLTATDADTDAADLGWETAGGADEERFALSASGELVFATAPDFEAPDDADGDGDYEVTVRVSDGANTSEAALTVRLQDVDDIAPELSSASVDGTVVTLAWSETLDTDSKPAADAFAVTVAGSARTVDTVALSGSAVRLTLASAVVADETVTVGYTAPTGDDAAALKDPAGNAATGFSGEAVTNNTPAANTAPSGLPEISGTAQVGETLRASADAITDADGIDNATFAWQWLAITGNDDSEIAGATGATYEVAAEDVGKTLKVRVTFSDDKGTQETLESAATAVVTVPLTAVFENLPAEHDGSNVFTFRLRFSEAPALSYTVLRDESFAVTGGEVDKARRVDGRNDLREIHVKPKGHDEVRLTLVGGRPCGTHGAICTADGRALSNTLTATVQGPPALNVADASGGEGEDASLDFVVTLSRAASGTVSVDYATADGSATAGEDYTATSGTLTFAAGETTKSVSVPLLDDVVNDGGETFTLTLSNPAGAWIEDGEATGTIENDDAMPAAWTARFGRSVATHVLDALEGRLETASGSYVRLGGHRLGGGPDVREAVERLAPDNDLSLWEEAETSDASGRNMTLKELLLGSAFNLVANDSEETIGPQLSAWGRVATSGFDGQEDRLALNGTVTTATLGVDGVWEHWLTGVALAYSEGDGSFTEVEAEGGDLASSLTSVHPYVAWALSDRVRLWGMAGYGTGSLQLRLAEQDALDTDLSMTMGALGVRGSLLEPSQAEGGMALALRSDVLWLRMDTAAVDGMVATEADVSRLRLVLEASRPVSLASGGLLIPTLEVGLRRDGGDAETGSGVEVGGSLRYTSAWGLSLEASVRGLLAHEASEYREWGASGALRFDPGRQGLGLSASIAPVWGSAGSGVSRLWGQADASGLAVDDTLARDRTGRVDAELGYGLAALRGRGLLTPYVRAALAEGSEQAWHLGARLDVARSLNLSLEASRRERQGDAAAHELALRAILPW